MDIIIDGFIYEYPGQGGISKIFDNVLPVLCNLDEHVKVRIFLTKNPKKPVPKHHRISTIDIYSYDRIFRPWRVWRNHYSVIHNKILAWILRDTKEKIWFSTFYTVPKFRWQGPKVVLVHDFIHELFPCYFQDSDYQREKKKQAICSSDAVICVSASTAKDLIRFYPDAASKVSVVKNGYSPVFHKKDLGEIKTIYNRPFILFIGKRKYYKGFDTLLSAYANWSRNQEIQLVVVGESWSAEEEVIIDRMGLKDRVILFANASDDQLCDLYNQAEAFIYPSIYEGFGIPLLEAMACGCPIVASRIPSTIEVAQDIPHYFEAGNIEDLVNALDQAIQDKSNEARNRAGISLVSQYSWHKMATNIYSVMKSLSGI